MKMYHGRGGVYLNGEKVANVRYDLTESTDYIDIGVQRIKGSTRTYGSIVVTTGIIKLSEEYELRPDQGNIVSFFANLHSRSSPDRYGVIVSGQLGDADES
jgi:hypothetical protein